MIDSYLRHAVAELLGFYEQLGVHEEPNRLYVYLVYQALRDQFERTVYVSIAQVEEGSKHKVVRGRGEVAVERVTLADAESYNQVGQAYEDYELLQLSDVELVVPVRVEDVVVLGTREPGFECGPITPVSLVVDNPHPGMTPGELIGDLASAVGAAVVDNYYL